MDYLLRSEDEGKRKIMSDRKAYKELKRNTLIIAVANIGSKAISFILAPLYSYFLSTSQYGTMDLITTTAGLLIPFFCLDVFEAVFRYSSENEYNDSKIISSSLAVCIPGLILSMCVFVFSIIINSHTKLIGYTIICVLLGSIVSILSQYARGKQEMKSFAATGIINSVVMLVLNLILLVFLRLGLDGWLMSYVIAQGCTVLFLVLRFKIYHKVKPRFVDRNYIKIFLRFCAPLIPTAAMWWVMNASDRYMIALFLGTSLNGVYSAAAKLPALLSVFENIFYQAWQTTAINKADDKDRNKFYSDIFNKYIAFLSLGVLALLLIGKSLIVILFAKEYGDAWICLAPLIIGVLFHALAGNLGSLYSVFKNTKGALYSTVVGAVCNILLNIIIIPKFGIFGAAITTLIGYIVTLVFRWFDVKQFVIIELKSNDTILYMVLIALQFILYYIDGLYSYVFRFAVLIFVVVKNRNFIVNLLRKGK